MKEFVESQIAQIEGYIQKRLDLSNEYEKAGNHAAEAQQIAAIEAYETSLIHFRAILRECK